MCYIWEGTHANYHNIYQDNVSSKMGDDYTMTSQLGIRVSQGWQTFEDMVYKDMCKYVKKLGSIQ